VGGGDAAVVAVAAGGYRRARGGPGGLGRALLLPANQPVSAVGQL